MYILYYSVCLFYFKLFYSSILKAYIKDFSYFIGLSYLHATRCIHYFYYIIILRLYYGLIVIILIL